MRLPLDMRVANPTTARLSRTMGRVPAPNLLLRRYLVSQRHQRHRRDAHSDAMAPDVTPASARLRRPPVALRTEGSDPHLQARSPSRAAGP